MANLLLQENCTVTIMHSRTRDLIAECRQADIVGILRLSQTQADASAHKFQIE